MNHKAHKVDTKGTEILCVLCAFFVSSVVSSFVSQDRKASNGRVTPCSPSVAGSLFEDVDILLLADFLELFGPDRDRDFAEVRLAQEQHLHPALTDAAAD